ncbi:MAG: hypothetical protein K8F25_14400 [Fimbriimonadaceae bacterium]|nr:hypothetical protein [Alphaproteobacteria bacterium]
MFRSYWIVFFALGLAVLASNTFSQEKPPPFESEPVSPPRQEQSTATPNQQSAPEQPQAPNISPALKGIEGAIRDLIADENEIDRQRQNQRGIDDLQAQQDMALWAKGMFWTTFVTVLLTAVALYAIVRTLHHTRRAADSAKDMVVESVKVTKAARVANKIANEANAAAIKANQAANRAARDGVKVTRDIGQAQTRAYITCLSCRAVNVFVNHAPGAQIVVKNTGQTPGGNLQVRVGMHVRPFPERNDKILFAGENRTTLGLESGQEEPYEFTRGTNLNGTEIAEIGAKTGALYFDIEIEYTDVFGLNNLVKQRFIHADPVRQGPAKVAKYGNEYRWGQKA